MVYVLDSYTKLKQCLKVLSSEYLILFCMNFFTFLIEKWLSCLTKMSQENQEIFSKNREVKRYLEKGKKSGDLPTNREIWSLCTY